MAEAKALLGLPRAKRLQESYEFRRIKAEGNRVVKGCLIANWMSLNTNESSRVGVVSSKKVGGAVDRNRARRLLRETFRLHQHELRCPVAMVLVARASIVGKKRGEVERDFLEAMRRAKMMGDKNE